MDNKESDLVEAALSEAIKSIDGYRDGDVLMEWACIVYTAHPLDLDHGGSGYNLLYSNGSLPDHVARGLLHTVLNILDGEQSQE